MDKQVGRLIHLPYAVVAEREYDDIRLYIGDGSEQENERIFPIAPVPITIPGKTFVWQQHKFFETELIYYKNNISIPKNCCVKWFDYDKIENAVEIRTRREGDYIQINSNGGNKKLKDYFIDHKVPRRLRDSRLLVTDGNHVMWIVGDGERISEKYKVDDTTSRVLVMKMFDLEEDADDKEG
jgi:tRNA(Ile)-lysidine synthase